VASDLIGTHLEPDVLTDLIGPLPCIYVRSSSGRATVSSLLWHPIRAYKSWRGCS
jgi:hypothetical protein